jgi:hypothetical protein
LLRAVRRPGSRPSAEAAAAAYRALKQSLGLDEIAVDRILAAQTLASGECQPAGS